MRLSVGGGSKKPDGERRSGCKMCVGGGLVGDVLGDFVGREAAIVGGEAGMALSFDGICFGAFAVAVEFGESLVYYG